RRIEVDWHYIDPGAFSSDSKHFVGVRDKHWCLWDLDVPGPAHRLHQVIGHERILFSRDSRKVVLVSHPWNSVPFLQIWDVKSKLLEQAVKAGVFFGKPPHEGNFGHLAWGADQTFFVEAIAL